MKICTLCGAEFSIAVVIDGRKRNLYRRRYCFGCSPWGKHNTRTLRRDDAGKTVVVKVVKQGRNVVCSRCGRKYLFGGAKGHTLTLCNSCNATRARIRLKQRSVDYKGGKCEKCGYNKCLRSLGFHHNDSTTKEFAIGQKTTHAWETIKNELDKCMLVCANCHGEIHDEAG